MSIQVTENELQCVRDNGEPVLRCKTRNELEATIESLEIEGASHVKACQELHNQVAGLQAELAELRTAAAEFATINHQDHKSWYYRNLRSILDGEGGLDTENKG